MKTMTDYKAVKIIRNGIEYCFPNAQEPYLLDALVVGGGGGGGCGNGNGYGGGGGGGGAVIECCGFYSLCKAASITVGCGGYDSNGGDSSVGYITAIGGGRGGDDNHVGNDGGSGGGGGGCGWGGCAGGIGCPGGNGNNAPGSGYGSGGAGGGAGGNACGANGGPGIASCMSGVCQTYGGGGAAGSGDTNNKCYYYGCDGGGDGAPYGVGSNGEANRGGGGAGASAKSYGAGKTTGGSGVVIVRYPTNGDYGITCSSGGTCCYVCNGYCIHVFNEDGTFTRLG